MRKLTLSPNLKSPMDLGIYSDLDGRQDVDYPSQFPDQVSGVGNLDPPPYTLQDNTNQGASDHFMYIKPDELNLGCQNEDDECLGDDVQGNSMLNGFLQNLGHHGANKYSAQN